MVESECGTLLDAVVARTTHSTGSAAPLSRPRAHLCQRLRVPIGSSCSRSRFRVMPARMKQDVLEQIVDVYLNFKVI
jgi:hypothetical protein